MNTISEDLGFLKTQAGNYILMEGEGIMDGFSYPSKHTVYKILSVNESYILLHQYGRKQNSILTSLHFNQKYKIFSPAEYKKLPVY